MRVQWVDKIVGDGEHNAFTGMARFNGMYYIVFRKGHEHADESGRQIMLTSEDGRQWKEVYAKSFADELKSPYGIDYRDSYFLNLGDELRLYSFSTPFDAKGERQPRESFSTVQITKDGLNWTAPQVIHRGGVLWKPIYWKKQFWCAGYYRKPHPGPLVVALYQSEDGVDWKFCGEITEGNETALYATKDGLRAFVRTNEAPHQLEIWDEKPGQNGWEKVAVVPKSIQCPHLQELQGSLYLFGREIPQTTEAEFKPPSSLRRTRGWKVDGTTLTQVLELPSGGDTAYVGIAEKPDGSFLVSYYSQHEITDPNPEVDDPNSKPTDLFVAGVSLK